VLTVDGAMVAAGRPRLTIELTRLLLKKSPSGGMTSIVPRSTPKKYQCQRAAAVHHCDFAGYHPGIRS
jgi:hypothetical protein